MPNEIADELVAKDVAVRPLGTRGGPLGESVSVAIDVVNTGSALVSIGAAVATCRSLAAASLQRRRSTDPDELTISITVDGENQSLTLDRTDSDAEDKALDFFVAALNVE